MDARWRDRCFAQWTVTTDRFLSVGRGGDTGGSAAPLTLPLVLLPCRAEEQKVVASGAVEPAAAVW